MRVTVDKYNGYFGETMLFNDMGIERFKEDSDVEEIRDLLQKAVEFLNIEINNRNKNK